MSGIDFTAGCYGDPEGDYADRDTFSPRTTRKMRQAQAERNAQPSCFVEGCPHKTTANGILCMSHFIDSILERKA